MYVSYYFPYPSFPLLPTLRAAGRGSARGTYAATSVCSGRLALALRPLALIITFVFALTMTHILDEYLKNITE